MIVRRSDLQSKALDMQSTESVLLHGMAWWTLTIVRATRLKNTLIKELISCHYVVVLTLREICSDVRSLDTVTNPIPSPYSPSTSDSRFVSSPIDHRITYVFHNFDENSVRADLIHQSCYHHRTWKEMTGVWGPNGQKSYEIRLSSTIYLRLAMISYLNWIGWIRESLDVSIVSVQHHRGFLRSSRLGWWETRIKRPFHVTVSEYLDIKHYICSWYKICPWFDDYFAQAIIGRWTSRYRSIDDMTPSQARWYR